MRSRLLITLVGVTVMTSAQSRKVTDAEVRRVHRSALLIDTHNDVPNEQKGVDREVPGFDLGARSTATHTDLPRLREEIGRAHV